MSSSLGGRDVCGGFAVEGELRESRQRFACVGRFGVEMGRLQIGQGVVEGGIVEGRV